MGSFHIFPFLSLLLLSSPGVGFSHGDSCKPLPCTKDGPEIRFPFTRKDLHPPPHCGYPGFELSCRDRNTLIHIPSLNGDHVVHSIDYREETMTLIADPNPNPKDCSIWHLLYKGLNLSASPFVFDSLNNFTFINCSTALDSGELSYNVRRISCLGDLEHDVFFLDATRGVGTIPVSCQPLTTVPMPLSEAYIEGNHCFVINLKWDVPRCKACRGRGMECGFKNESSTDITCFDHRGEGISLDSFFFFFSPFLLAIVGRLG